MDAPDDRRGPPLEVVDTPENGRARTVNLLLFGVFVLVTALAILDVSTDLRAGTTAVHVVIEGAIAVLGVVGAGILVRRIRVLGREAQALRDHTQALASNLETSRAEAARWRRDASDLIAGLSAAIDRQLDQWGLTRAEQEIALLLLKGLSHKEVATLRAVSESTVRQQARAIYRKASVSGRHDLAAFFLEDLLGPRPAPS